MKEVNGIWFNVTAVKEMGLASFKQSHKHFKFDLDAAYYEITGEKKVVRKKK